MTITPGGSKGNFEYLDLSYPEDSVVVNNTTNKIRTIADELNYLDLASQANFSSRDANINFAGKTFTDMAEINLAKKDELLENEVLTSKSKRIAAYDKENVRKLFTYKENGFEYRAVEEGLLNEISNYQGEDIKYHDILNASKATFAKWAEEQGIDYDKIIPLGLVYRAENPIPGAQPTASLTHIDFDQNNTSEFMRANSLVWKGVVDQALGNYLSQEEFENIKIEHMVNMWMPLEDKPTENTLAMLDRSRIQSEDLRPFTAVFNPFPSFEVKFTAMTLSPSNKHQYVIQSDMKLGDMVLFNTFDTPHSAVTVPRPEAQKGLARRSVEIRAIFIKDKDI